MDQYQEATDALHNAIAAGDKEAASHIATWLDNNRPPDTSVMGAASDAMLGAIHGTLHYGAELANKAGLPSVVGSTLESGASRAASDQKKANFHGMSSDDVSWTDPASAVKYGAQTVAGAAPYLLEAATLGPAAIPLFAAQGAGATNDRLEQVAPNMDEGKRLAIAGGAGTITAALQTLGLGTLFKTIPASALEKLGVNKVAQMVTEKLGDTMGQKFLAAATPVARVAGASASNAATMAASEGVNIGAESMAGATPSSEDIRHRLKEAAIGGATLGGVIKTGEVGAEVAGNNTPTAIKDRAAQRTVDADIYRAASSQRVMEAMNTRRASEQARSPSLASSDDVLAKRVRDEYIGGARRLLNDLLLSNKITKEQRDRWTNGTDGFLKEAGQGNRPLLQTDIDAVHDLGLSHEDTQSLQNVLFDIDTANTNGFKKNLEPGKYEKAGRVVGHLGGMAAGVVGGHYVPGFGPLPEIAGAVIGGGAGAKFGLADITGGAGRAVDKMMGNQLPAVTRIAKAADRVGMQSDSSDTALTDMQQRARDERVAVQAQRQADAEAEAAQTQQEREAKQAQREQEKQARQAQKDQDRAAKEQAQRDKLNTQQAARVQAAQDKATAQAQRAAAQAQAQQAKADAAQKRAEDLAQNKATRELQAQAKADAAQQKQAATQAKLQAKLDAETAKNAAKQEQDRIFREQNIKDRENNVVAGGGFHARVYDQTGLLPREQDRGLDMLLQNGDITADEAHNFVHNPHALKANARGLKIEDALNRLADDGHLTRTEEKAASAEAPAANNAPEVRPIINPHSYKRAMANINAATKNALDNAPTPEVRASVADLAENKGTPELKKLALAEMRSRFPEHQKFIDEVVAPIAEFGPKRSNILTDEGGGGHPRDILDMLKKAGGGFRRFLKDERGSLGGPEDENAGFDDKVRAAPEASALAGKYKNKDGTYRGAPKEIDTPSKLGALRKSLYEAAKTGAVGRFWYERSSRAILDAVGGNKVEAEKLAQLIAIFSPNTPVKGNFDYALQAYHQYKQTGQIRTGQFPEAMSAKAQAVMEGRPWNGRKTNNFYINLMRHIDPSAVQGVTGDVWIMRAFGFAGKNGKPYKGSPTTAQYDFVERETKRIMDKLNSELPEGEAKWEPQQVQAAIWVAEKAREEAKKSPGYSVNDSRFDFAHALEDTLAQISWESVPGKTTGHLPEIHDAPYSVRADYHTQVSKAFLGNKGDDMLAKAIGIPTPGNFEAPGYYEGKSNPGSQNKLAAPQRYTFDIKEGKLEPAAKQALDIYSAAMGLILRQEAVPYHRPFPVAKSVTVVKADKATGQKAKTKTTTGVRVGDANGAEVSIGRPLTVEETERLGASLAKVFETGDINPIGAETGARVLNTVGLENKVFHTKLEQAVHETFPGDTTVHVDKFGWDGNYLSNKWKESPNGEDYQRVLQTGSPDVQKAVHRVISEISKRVDAIDQEFAEKHGWTIKPRNTNKGILATEGE